MENFQDTSLRILLVKTRGRSTANLSERVSSEQRGEAPRGTLFERTLKCDVVDEASIEAMTGIRGWVYKFIPTFAAQGLEARRRAGSYDVVITWSERHTVAVAALFVLFRTPTPHLAMMFWMSKPVVRLPLRVFRKGVDRIVTWSSVQRSVAVNHIGFQPEEVVLVHHPVDLQFFRPIESVRESIFSAGSTQRDFPTLIEAAEVLGLPIRIAASLVVKLKGLRIDTTDVRETLGTGDSVEIEQMGSVQLRSSYSSAKIVVVPLQPSDIDAGVNVILEGMAMGRPVVATKTAGQVDVIKDGENARFVAPGDVAELRRVLEELLGNPEAAEAMGRRGRAHVEKYHGLETFIERIRLNALEVSELGSRR